MTEIYNFLDWAKDNSALLDFIYGDLLSWTLISLMFGFFVLLLELRLPLRYYWDIPIYILSSLLEAIGLKEKTPIWGYCLDRESKQVIPITAVELLDSVDKKRVLLTYANRLGQYGFKPSAGKYILRAIKNHYLTPSVLDPENIQLVEIKESYALPIKVGSPAEKTPQVNLELQPFEKFDPKNPKSQLQHYIKTFIFTISNGFLTLAVISSLFAWAVTKELFFGLFLATSIVLLFIKIYILETIGDVTVPQTE